MPLAPSVTDVIVSGSPSPSRSLNSTGIATDTLVFVVADGLGGYAAGERYLPEGMQPPGWYQPTDRGLEAKIREKLAWMRSRDKEGSGKP